MEINRIKTQRALAPTQISLADYVINPYRGCSLGCRFCYVRFNKNVARRKQAWGEFVDIKENLPLLLEQELKDISPKRVLLGSTTEVFMPEEERFRLTSKIIKILAKNTIPVVILTRSPLIEKYLPLLCYSLKNKIYFTFIKRPLKISQPLEPKSASWQRRRKTLKAIIKAGISLRVHIGPFIPFLDNLDEVLKVMPEGIREIEVEIFNPYLGNWPELRKILTPFADAPLLQNIDILYSQKQPYNEFCQELKYSLERVKKRYGFSCRLLICPRSKFYTPDIIYEPPAGNPF